MDDTDTSAELKDPSAGILIGITRTVAKPDPENGPLAVVTYMTQHSSDVLRIELPEGEFVRSLWMTINGMEICNMPLEPEHGLWIYNPNPQQWAFAQWVRKLRGKAGRRKPYIMRHVGD